MPPLYYEPRLFSAINIWGWRAHDDQVTVIGVMTRLI